MDKSNLDFIVKVACCVTRFSQFPSDICYWIGCQFALESSYGHSSLAIDDNNYCGMKNPLVRISSAIYAGFSIHYWAKYVDLDSCVIDYLLCLQYHKPISTNYDTIDHFSKFLSKFYCPEKDYIDKINRIYSQFKSFQNGKS